MTTIRSYQAGDEVLLVDLANRAHAPYAGPVPRTVEHWRWSILRRPGVTPEDVLLLVTGNGAVLGFGVLGPAGVVLELCLDPGLVGAERAVAAGALKTALEARCLAGGQESILFELPSIDEAVRALLLGDGYREEVSASQQILLVDVEEALRRLLVHQRDRLPGDRSPVFLLELGPGHYRRKETLRLRVAPRDPDPVGAAAAGAAADIRVRSDLSTLADIMLRRLPFDEARRSGRIDIEPASGEADVRTLFAGIVLEHPWYAPPADGR